MAWTRDSNFWTSCSRSRCATGSGFVSPVVVVTVTNIGGAVNTIYTGVNTEAGLISTPWLISTRSFIMIALRDIDGAQHVGAAYLT